ncbi:MAG: hypothetical protein WCC84_11415 [Candidatus Cybelea sp.]
MFLLSVLLSAITFNPAMAGPGMAPLSGVVEANPIQPDAMCKPGAICASATLPIKRNGCHVNNFWNSAKGGTPLTIDVTETGSNGSKVFIYWVNATSSTITITKTASANYYCPK